MFSCLAGLIIVVLPFFRREANIVPIPLYVRNFMNFNNYVEFYGCLESWQG